MEEGGPATGAAGAATEAPRTAKQAVVMALEAGAVAS